MMSRYKLINLPTRVDRSVYDRTIEYVVDRIVQSDGVQSVYQIGGLSDPGISDIDLIAVFDDGAIVEVDPLEGLDKQQRYLVVHDVFATCETLFARAQDFTFYHNYKLLYGKEQPLGCSLSEDDVSVLQSHIAVEYLQKMFITLTLQLEYNVIRVRDLFLHVNAVRFDLEFLGIMEGTLHRLTSELIDCRRNWFNKSVSAEHISTLVDSFYESLREFLESPAARAHFYFPGKVRHTVSKSIFVSASPAELAVNRRGVKLPPVASKLGKIYFKAQNRLNDWHFSLPARSVTPPSILAERFQLMGEIVDYNARHLPRYSGFMSGLTFHTSPEERPKLETQPTSVELRLGDCFLEEWEASVVSHLLDKGLTITFFSGATEERNPSSLREWTELVVRKRTHIRHLLSEHAILEEAEISGQESARRVLSFGAMRESVPSDAVLYRLLIGDGVGRPCDKEILQGNDTIRVRVVRWSNGVRDVVRDGWLKCFLHSRDRTLNLVSEVVKQWLVELLLDARNARGEVVDVRDEESDVSDIDPPGRVAFLLTSAARQVARVRRALTTEKWNVGLVAAPVSRFLESDFRPDVTWLPEPPPGYLHADPFGLVWNDRLVILFERGRLNQPAGISYVEMHDDQLTEPVPIFDLPWHQSYPYLIEHEGRVFCVPSVEDSGSVMLFEAIEFPTKWSEPVILLEGVPGIDSTLVQWNDRWWMFMTRKDYMDNHELFIYHADRIDSKWYPHDRNPVKTDIRGARPAGTPFIVNGHLIRPSQDSSREYGGRVILNRVVELSPERFREEPVTSVEPVSPYTNGLHNVAACGEMTLVDGKLRLFKTSHFLRRR